MFLFEITFTGSLEEFKLILKCGSAQPPHQLESSDHPPREAKAHGEAYGSGLVSEACQAQLGGPALRDMYIHMYVNMCRHNNCPVRNGITEPGWKALHFGAVLRCSTQ